MYVKDMPVFVVATSRWIWWLAPMPFSAAIFIYDEVKHLIDFELPLDTLARRTNKFLANLCQCDNSVIKTVMCM